MATDLEMRWIGPSLRAEAAISVDARLSLTDAHALAHRAELHLQQQVPRLIAASVHVGPIAKVHATAVQP